MHCACTIQMFLMHILESYLVWNLRLKDCRTLKENFAIKKLTEPNLILIHVVCIH